MSTIADPPDPAAQERVQRETVDAGLAGSYPDAVEIQARIQAGRIAVQEAPQLSAPFEEVLELYGLQEGDKAVVRLAVQVRDVEATVTDDRLLSVVLQHTLLRNVANEKGVHYAMELSGHRSDRDIWRYVRPDEQSLAEAMDELN